jgi:hypothetical protein
LKKRVMKMTHLPEADRATEERDQREFDEAVNRDGKYVLEALAAIGIVAALVMSAVALLRGPGTSGTAAPAPAAQVAAVRTPVASSTPAAAQVVDLKVIGSYKLGPDGKKHDAFTTTDFAVRVGQPLKLRIDNTDDVNHSISSPAAGVNIIVAPGTHTYTMVVKTAGRYLWYCMIPCDSDAHGWAMQNPGFMSGYITAT